MKVRATADAYEEVVAQLRQEGRIVTPPVVTDPDANPFPDVPLPADFREKPLPPVPSSKTPQRQSR